MNCHIVTGRSLLERRRSSCRGSPEAAAAAYAGVIENGAYEYWWTFNVNGFPYAAEVEKEPQYIEAHKQLMTKLKQQRQQLIEYVRLEEMK